MICTRWNLYEKKRHELCQGLVLLHRDVRKQRSEKQSWRAKRSDSPEFERGFARLRTCREASLGLGWFRSSSIASRQCAHMQSAFRKSHVKSARTRPPDRESAAENHDGKKRREKK
jgi:hypothetical protein